MLGQLKYTQTGWSPGLVVKKESHVLKVVGLNPSTIYWTDIFHINFVLKIVLMCGLVQW